MRMTARALPLIHAHGDRRQQRTDEENRRQHEDETGLPYASQVHDHNDRKDRKTQRQLMCGATQESH